MSIFPRATLSGEGVPEITSRELFEVALGKDRREIELIDVRRPDEFTGPLGHIAGAQLVTLELDFAQWLEKADKSKTYVFVCRMGSRSLRAASLAQAHGFADTYNLEGGMTSWSSQGLPVER